MLSLPESYLDYLRGENSKEGGLSVEPGWFQLWALDEVKEYNQQYQIEKFIPDFVGFGSSGGGELLAFNSSGRVFMVPFIGMSKQDAKDIAASWNEFVDHMER
jgi:hypothetical protein